MPFLLFLTFIVLILLQLSLVDSIRSFPVQQPALPMADNDREREKACVIALPVCLKCYTMIYMRGKNVKIHLCPCVCADLIFLCHEHSGGGRE